jgi:hypothetical protein
MNEWMDGGMGIVDLGSGAMDGTSGMGCIFPFLFLFLFLFLDTNLLEDS